MVSQRDFTELFKQIIPENKKRGSLAHLVILITLVTLVTN